VLIFFERCYIITTCHKHTNLKKEKEVNPTGFWLGQGPKQAKGLFYEDAEKDARNSPSKPPTPLFFSFMFSKKNRTNKKEVERIFKVGRFVGTTNLTLKFIKNSEKTSPKVSFIVPKTVAKKAVDRNLLRRRGYVVLEKYLQRLPVGFLGAFVFGKKSKEVFGGRNKKTIQNSSSKQNLENEIKILLNKA